MEAELLVGAAFGVAASLVAWLSINHGLRPDVKVSSFISRYSRLHGPGSEQRERLYRIKLYNSRRRPAADLRAEAYVWLKAPDKKRPDNNELVTLTVTPDDFVGLGPSHRKILYLRPDPDALRRLEFFSLAADERTVDDLLALPCEKSEVRLWLSYTDGYSGIRRASYHSYSRGAIQDWPFERGRSVERGAERQEAGGHRDGSEPQ